MWALWLPFDGRGTAYEDFPPTGTQCRMLSSSKYAVDTRRMILTGKVRQGVPGWPQLQNYPGKEFISRYDMYPKPDGQECQATDGLVEDAPPTGLPPAQVQFPQAGACNKRFTKKTSVSGASNPSPPGQAINEKSRACASGGNRLAQQADPRG